MTFSFLIRPDRRTPAPEGDEPGVTGTDVDGGGDADDGDAAADDVAAGETSIEVVRVRVLVVEFVLSVLFVLFVVGLFLFWYFSALFGVDDRVDLRGVLVLVFTGDDAGDDPGVLSAPPM